VRATAASTPTLTAMALDEDRPPGGPDGAGAVPGSAEIGVSEIAEKPSIGHPSRQAT